jgi:hypothetical protein
MFFTAPAILALYTGIVIVVSLVAPATVVGIGDNYCYGFWCVGVRNVRTLPDAADKVVTVDVRIFGTGSARGAIVYMLDEHNHRFPLVDDSSNRALDTALVPGQLMTTSLTFRVPGDAQHLFLTGDPGIDRIDWRQTVQMMLMTRRLGPAQMIYLTRKLNLGADFSLLHRHWMLQVV